MTPKNGFVPHQGSDGIDRDFAPIVAEIADGADRAAKHPIRQFPAPLPSPSPSAIDSPHDDGHDDAMPDQPDTTDLRIQVSDARTDTKFAQLMGEMRTSFAALNGRLDSIEKTTNARFEHLDKMTSGTKTTVMVTGLAVIAAMVGILTYGQGWFGIGISTREVVRSAVTEYVQQHPAPSAVTKP